jgi:hypothetical protein
MKVMTALMMLILSFVMFESYGLAITKSAWWIIVTFISAAILTAAAPWVRKVFTTEMERD